MARSAASHLVPLDRVLWQRIEVDADGPRRAFVAGTRHHRPATVRIDLDTAFVLVEAGVPTVTRRVGSAT